jgi:anti-sigma regulatory factor (Ser/Thr protein kinase)
MLHPVRTLPLPSVFGPRSIAGWLAERAQTVAADGLVLLVRAGTRLEPAGIVLLAAEIARRTEEQRSTSLEFEPGSEGALRELADLRFFQELGLPEPQSPAVPERCVPLRRIADLGTARKLADRTRDLLEREQPDLAPSPVRAAQFVFEELGANIVQHSGRTSTGFGLARADRERGRLQVAFADAGIGYWRSLVSNPEFEARIESHAAAIRLAQHSRVTRGGRGNMGLGLHLFAELAQRLRGDTWIASGDALVERSFAAPGGPIERSLPIAEWSGAWICLEVPLEPS